MRKTGMEKAAAATGNLKRSHKKLLQDAAGNVRVYVTEMTKTIS